MDLAGILDRIPYLRVHHLEAREDPGGAVTLRMPLSETVTNHVGIVHAGALFTAAETAAGVAAWRVIAGDRAFVLLRGATVRYTRRAEGDVVARASVDSAIAGVARGAFDEAGRADVTVEVNATDPAGETVFEGSFDYALRPGRAST
ncbi:MAG: DUF4442 domain-containing protein [Deltaproteobacteria bacterium]|nr:DUF4442 domain-containing protein [Deltaproteobacteria bacterium]